VLTNSLANNSCHLEGAHLCFFESNEGKNLSDCIGSQAKAALTRGSLMTSEGVGQQDSPQIEADIMEQIKQRMLSQLNIETDGRLGSYSFWRYILRSAWAMGIE
jgi:hypothetical protein